MPADSIIVPSSTVSHVALVNYLNNANANPDSSVFYENLAAPIAANTLIKETYVFLNELYEDDGTTLAGFFVVGFLDNIIWKLFLFDARGNPVSYCFTGVSGVFTLDDYGNIIYFVSDNPLVLTMVDGSPNQALNILFKSYYGNTYPMVEVSNPAGGQVLSRGIMDVLYDGRASSSYVVFIDDENPVGKFLVTNLTNADINVNIQLDPVFSFPYKIPANGTCVIPNTPTSAYHLQQMYQTLKSITYTIIS
jgi:hypothetical protein